MANPIWITGGGTKAVDLGTVTEGIYFEFPLESYDPAGAPVTYKFLAGVLPPGIRISSDPTTSTGKIQGGPLIDDPANQTISYEFTVRAFDQHNLVSDKSFKMTIANIVPPAITPRVTDLGQIFDGTYYSKQLEATELNPYATLTWSSIGALPPGLTLSNSGLLSGHVAPLVTYSNLGTLGFNASPYNEFGYENAPQYQSNNYQFAVKVFDGANYDTLTYTLYVTARDNFTADTTYISIDDSKLTIDHNNIYVPIITTPSQSIPEVRSNSKFAFQFQAYDPKNQPVSFSFSQSGEIIGFDEAPFDSIGFDQESLSVPPGLILDTDTGWLTGTISAQVQAVQTYTFNVVAYDTEYPDRISDPATFTMTVLGDITNTITWTTAAKLGIIDNGAISQLSVSAVNHSNRPLTYSLVSGGSLPQGLEVYPSGLIVGRTSFEFFSLDGGTTTIDGSTSNFDNSYTFTVQAATTDGTASGQQTFTLLVNNFNSKPYENIYLKALPTVDQRNLFLSIVNNNDIFPEELIYRSSDPWFGRARDIRSLFLAGLNPSSIDTYLAAMSTNTYNKRINFSNIKTAQAVDANFNVKYEVVYLELEDSSSYKGNSPANSQYDPLINQNVYPNSFVNMGGVITEATGYANRGAIPDWMSSPQANKKQLGFTRAVVLAYTVPGASKLIAYRLETNGISFNNINFVADRYDLDNSLSSNYNLTLGSFNLGRETTFDRIKRPGTIATSVTYGVTGLSFNSINNQTVASIQARGGLDGVTDFIDGDTLIFLQQENFGPSVGNYDGWRTANNTLVPGYVEFTNSTKIANGTGGFPSSPVVGQTVLVNNVYYQYTIDYDTSGNIIDTVWKVANLRANVWKINISSGVVTLTPVLFLRNSGSGLSLSQFYSSIVASDRVQINKGISHSDTIVFFNPVLGPSLSVPAYSVIPTLLAPGGGDTRFDGYGTRFINNRDSFELLESGDSWLKFPPIELNL